MDKMQQTTYRNLKKHLCAEATRQPDAIIAALGAARDSGAVGRKSLSYIVAIAEASKQRRMERKLQRLQARFAA